MRLAEGAIGKRTLTTFVTFVAVVAGLLSYGRLGQLEDPEFTIKSAVVVTPYPGASPEEVELEVTDVLEQAVQTMSQLKELESYSRSGLSSIKVTIKPSYRSDKLPQVWDELRKKVRDTAADLPPGAGPSQVFDEFGDVYGLLLSVQSDGFTPAELESFADDIKKELSVVPGVAKVALWGVQPQCIYVEVSDARLSQLGIAPADIQQVLTQQNLVIDAGSMDLQSTRMRFQVAGEFTSPEDIGDLVIPGRSISDPGGRGRLLRIRDIATVRRGYLEPAVSEHRFNGRPAIAIAISNAPGANVVKVGETVDHRLEELRAELPVGIEIGRISWQAEQVSSATTTFLISLAEAVAIVLGVLWLTMGLRSAFVVGFAGLVMVILMTFVVMTLIEEDMHRISLGALIIAMGMMVDNAIVVADGVQVRLQRGMDRIKAGIEAASQPSMPLLGATVVAVMAFYPIAASAENAGEYCAALFTIAGASLLISWLLAMTVTPLMCVLMLPTPKAGAGDPYAGAMFRSFRKLLRVAIRARYVVIIVAVAALVASLFSFRWVDQMFFPAAARAQFMVDLWLPEGARVQDTSAHLRRLEERIVGRGDVEAVSAFVGQGPPRFYLPVDPEYPYSSYGQLIVNVVDASMIEEMMPEVQSWADEHMPEAQVITRKYGIGPYKTWPVDVKISGPAIADSAVLRSLGEQAASILIDSPHSKSVRTNWRQRVPKVVAEYDEPNARWTGISRDAVGIALRRSFDGTKVGLYRERDKLLPIIARHVQGERTELVRNLPSLQIREPLGSRSVPLSQVTESVEPEWEDPLIWRFNRRRAIAAQAVPVGLATELLADVRPRIEAMEFPPGYSIMWDGEHREAMDAQKSLLPGAIPALIIMAVIVVALFNAYRPPLIIACLIPFAFIGVVAGLLITRQPFGFVALLGAMSLSGMMIKNAVILLDEIDIQKAAGSSDYDAIADAAVSRLRPVLLAAGTTVLGVIPLLPDVFWASMAVVIMFGLTVGSLITMILLPVLYSVFYRVTVPVTDERS